MKHVREIFAGKLHKGLGRGIPNKCLPLDFMGYYALSGKEEETKIKNTIKNYMITDINKRRDYVKTITMGSQGIVNSIYKCMIYVSGCILVCMYIY